MKKEIIKVLQLLQLTQTPEIIKKIEALFQTDIDTGNGFNFHMASHEPTTYSGIEATVLTVDGKLMGDINGDGDAEDFNVGNYIVVSAGGDFAVSLYMFFDRTGWTDEIEVEITGDTEYLNVGNAETYTIPASRSLTAIRLQFDSFPADSGSGSGDGADGTVNLTFTATGGNTTRSVSLGFEQA